MTAPLSRLFTCFFYSHAPPTEISPLSLHDALPILGVEGQGDRVADLDAADIGFGNARHHHPLAVRGHREDRKSTRLNSSHRCISYAVFCLKKKRTPCWSSTTSLVTTSTPPCPSATS